MGILVRNLPFDNDHLHEQAASAVDYYAEQDRRQTEYRARVPRLILEEKALVDSELAAGNVYVANHGKDRAALIHRSTCHTIRHQVDRDVAWEGHEHGMKYGMPNLVTREEVEALPAYGACLVCNPDTNERTKKRAQVYRPTALRNMSLRHVGRYFETLEGDPLGDLVSYTMAAGTVTLHFAAGDIIGVHDDQVVMFPKHEEHAADFS